MPDWALVPELPDPPTDLALAPRCWLVLAVPPPEAPEAPYEWYLAPPPTPPPAALVLLTLPPLLDVLEGRSEPE